MVKPFSGPLKGLSNDDAPDRDLYLALGFGIVRQDKGADPLSVFFERVQAFLDVGMPVLALVHSLSDAIAVHAHFGDRVQIEYKNEIDLSAMDLTAFAIYVRECRALAARGIRCWIGCLSTVKGGSIGALFASGLGKVLPLHLGLVFHGYGFDPGQLSAAIAIIRGFWKGAILCSEWGPQPVIADPLARVAWFAAMFKDGAACGIPVIGYRMVDVGDNSGFVTNNGWTTPYQPTTAYPLLRAALQPAA